ncbi:MAG: sulfite exporter TauE/SafE family protein [Vulcanimicrobiaceae bacterium]
MYGALIGFSLGLTGGGGSIITLPVLVYLIGQSVHQAIGTSLAVVGGVAAQGFTAQRRRVRFRSGWTVGLLGVLGNVPGSLLAGHVSSRLLLVLFAAVMFISAFAMLFVRLPTAVAGSEPHWIAVALVGVGLGFLTGFLGVGGGFLIVPMLVFALGFEMKAAIATSLFVIFVNTVVAIVPRLHHAQIDWAVAALLFTGGLAGNSAGLALAKGLDQRRLKVIFALFVLLVGAFTGLSALHLIPVNVK